MTLTTLTTNTSARRRTTFLNTSAMALVLAACPFAIPAGQAAAGSTTADDGLTKLESGPEIVIVRAVSGDGKTVVGQVSAGSFVVAEMWDDSGDQALFDDHNSSKAYGVNYDGSVIVGYADNSAAVWRNGVHTTLLGLSGIAYDVSNDGTVIVGQSHFSPLPSNFQAAVWTSDIGSPTKLSSHDNTLAAGVSGDGTIAVGYGSDGTAYKWVIGDTISETSLVPLNVPGKSAAYGISNDGSVIVGQSYLTAVMWDADDNVSKLDNDGYWGESSANAVNGNGTVIVGTAADSSSKQHAFRWTENDGMITVEQWLRDNGFDIEDDITKEATGVSDDGNVVVGNTNSDTAFIARASSGIIDTAEYQATLLNKPTTQVGINYANTILNGAHGQPMRDLLGVGQQSFSITNDTGYDDSGYSNGGLVIGDLTYARGFDGGITGRIALGGVYTDQDIATGGSFDVKGFYIAPEASIALGDSGVYATIGGYYSHGRMSIDRGYLNGGVMDYSSGKADTETFAAKLRFDWLNAASYDGTDFTPYAMLSYAHSKMDAYSETGGGFPSSFDAVKDHATVARIGVDMVHGLNDDIRLLGKAEASYRFEKETSGTSGSINGLSSFAFDGQDVDQFWVRAGAGAEFDIGGGTASLMVNVTTEGDDPNVWLRSGWTVKF